MPRHRRTPDPIDADGVVACLDRTASPTRRTGLRALRQRARVPSLEPSPTGVGSRAPAPCSSTRAHRGRTPGSNHSTAGSATNTSTAGNSIPCSRPRCSPRTGELTTTPTDPIVLTAASPRRVHRGLDQQTATTRIDARTTHRVPVSAPTAPWLIAHDEVVLDVATTATSRVRELSRGGRRKNDVIDASGAASVAVEPFDRPPRPNGPVRTSRGTSCETSVHSPGDPLHDLGPTGVRGRARQVGGRI